MKAMTHPLTNMASSAVVCEHPPRAQLDHQVETAPRLIYLQVAREE